MCDRIWEKGPLRAVPRIFILKHETIAAMNLNFGMNILPSSWYIRKEFRAPPISGMDGAHGRVDRVRKLLFYALLLTLDL